MNAAHLNLAIDAAAGRLATARATATLTERLARETDDVTLVAILAGSDLPVEDAVAARSLSSSAEVTGALRRTQWQVISAIAALADDRRDRAQAILTELRSTAAHDEHAAPLAPALSSAVNAAAALLAEVAPPPPPGPFPPPRPPRGVHGEASGRLSEVMAELARVAEQHPDAVFRVTWERTT